MKDASRVAIVGRSVRDLAAAWGHLQRYFTSADLIVTEHPVERALGGPSASERVVFAVLDRQGDLEHLLELETSPDWLFVLCPPGLMQSALAELRPLAIDVAPLDDAGLALEAMSTRVRRPGVRSSGERT